MYCLSLELAFTFYTFFPLTLTNTKIPIPIKRKTSATNQGFNLFPNSLFAAMEPPMYDHSQPLNTTVPITAGESDDGSGPDAGVDAQHQIQYETHGMDDSNSDAVYGNGSENPDFALQSFDESDQLTLSFRGQVYVFDSVTPAKV